MTLNRNLELVNLTLLFSPRYHIANAVQLAAQCLLFILIVSAFSERHSNPTFLISCQQVFLVWYNTRENSKRAKGERNHRLDAPANVVARLGDQHPDFRLTI